MPKIRILQEDLINKIAAGEVVERPASVVKELLDNSYDAGATHISIDIQEGGINKIHIVDNGEGMDKEDAEMAFKRHATSKIQQIEDLLNLKNYGFRGEALATISAVSKVTLKTRKKDQNLGTEIKIEGGQITLTTETGAPQGTSILIEDLFYNVPARKEFLKATSTEYKEILDIVDSYAIANPGTGISLVHNDKTIYNLPSDDKLEDRIRSILGSDTFEKLIPLFFEHPHLEIYGYVSKPELASERKKRQYIFVNKRPINNRSIAFNVKDAYGSLIPRNSYPVFLVFLDLPTNVVDVNVHPRKEEVKFSNDQFINTSVRSCVKSALNRTDLTPGAQDKGVPRSPFASPFVKNPFSPPTTPQTTKTSKPFSDPFWNAPYADPFGGMDDTLTPGSGMNSNFLQIHNLYIVAETETGLLIYDQHAVHERIIYEQLISKHQKKNQTGQTQGLLTPIVLNLSAQESTILAEHLETLKEAGFEIEEFGGNSYKITQVPAILSQFDIKGIIHEILDDLEEHQETKKVDSQSNKILTYLACRSAYKAGDLLHQEEIAAMIEKLKLADIEYTCPHGRPVKIELTWKELSRMFKRT